MPKQMNATYVLTFMNIYVISIWPLPLVYNKKEEQDYTQIEIWENVN